MSSNKAEVDKIKYHIRMLAAVFDYDDFPIEGLVLSFDWSEEDLHKAHDCFERAEMKIKAGEDFNYHILERSLKDSLGLDYQEVKSVAIAFFKSGQWTQVCEEYAKSFGDNPPIEIYAILNKE